MKKHYKWDLHFNNKQEPFLMCSNCGFEILLEDCDEYEYGFPLSCPKCDVKMYYRSLKDIETSSMALNITRKMSHIRSM